MSTFVSIGPSVGSHAPEVAVTGLESRTGPGAPRVLAFVEPGSIDTTDQASLQSIRRQLRGLGAELVVLSRDGVWAVRADDPIEQLAYGDDLAVDVAATSIQYGVRAGEDAVFVIDGLGIVRFAFRPERRIRPVFATLADALAQAGEAMQSRASHDAKQRVMFTRREWSVTCLVAGCASALFAACKDARRAPVENRAEPAVAPAPADVDITLSINGKTHQLRVDPRASLLDTLRERLGLTGSKKGCDAGQCGACTVLLGGKRVTSCLTLAVMAQGREVTTIEGLAKAGALHPMQQAFIEHDGLQCGYCTPGQIVSAVALLRENRATTDAEVREQMSGNICRCGAYPNIVAAIQAARRQPA
jgi:xanthine dehydrogenase YagT iron-sulfur-binding subunit